MDDKKITISLLEVAGIDLKELTTSRCIFLTLFLFQMENGETGHHGERALQLVVEGLKPEPGTVPIPPQNMEVVLVWGQHWKSKTAQQRIAQLVNKLNKCTKM